MTPTASVLLPVYNAERYIDAAVESVLNQSFGDFELLLLNDGSTDGSATSLEYFAGRDKRCRVHSWSNRGLIETLNAGVSLARADLLIRMDADDICRSGRFARQLAYMAEHPECVALGSRVMLIDAEGWPIAEFAADALDHDEIDAAHLAGRGGSIAHPTAVLRKNAVVRAGGYRTEFPHAEDIDLFLRLGEVGRLANLPEVLLDYRQHPTSVGYRHAWRQQQSARQAVVDACRRRGLSAPAPVALAETPSNVSTLAAIHRKWSWWALSGGHPRTARKHAWKAALLEPFSPDNLRLCACVLRGR